MAINALVFPDLATRLDLAETIGRLRKFEEYDEHR